MLWILMMLVVVLFVRVVLSCSAVLVVLFCRVVCTCCFVVLFVFAVWGEAPYLYVLYFALRTTPYNLVLYVLGQYMAYLS
jgi:hypothetical protein